MRPPFYNDDTPTSRPRCPACNLSTNNNGVRIMIVRIEDDFDLDKIAESGQCFRWRSVSDGGYNIIHAGESLYIRQTGDREYDVNCDANEFRSVWEPYFDLGEHYAAIRNRIDRQQDAFLYAASEYGKGIRILRQDPWETLVSFIISQNRNIPAIKKSVELLCQYAGETRTDSRGVCYHSFPTPNALSAMGEAALKACKVGYRWRYIEAAANDALNHKLNLARLLYADENETSRTLTGIYGVGIKVANCVSLYGLHHLDAFPVDVWIKRVLAERYPGGYPYQRYSPYNGVYQQYLFAYYRNRATAAF